jgi:hypothetical protein
MLGQAVPTSGPQAVQRGHQVQCQSRQSTPQILGVSESQEGKAPLRQDQPRKLGKWLWECARPFYRRRPGGKSQRRRSLYSRRLGLWGLAEMIC